jgi:putative oxidoreductase
MKIASIIIRILMGLMFLFSSVVVLFNLMPQPEMSGAIKTFNDGIKASIYLMPLIKGIELVCSIAFLSGRFVPLATIVIFPNVVNILLVHSFISSEGLPIAILLFLGNLFLAYYYRDYYKPLFNSK